MKSVAVFCGSSSGKDKEIIEAAYTMGVFLAQRGMKLVYGGGRVGLMGKVAQGALDNKGEVFGVIPHFLREKEVHHTGLTELVLVDTMHERKLKMHDFSEGVIMLPGGFGTLEEFFEMLTWGQLGLHQKPIGILNINGFYNPLIQMFDTMVANRFLSQENKNMVLVDETIEGLVRQMENYSSSVIPKWMNEEQT